MSGVFVTVHVVTVYFHGLVASLLILCGWVSFSCGFCIISCSGQERMAFKQLVRSDYIYPDEQKRTGGGTAQKLIHIICRNTQTYSRLLSIKKSAGLHVYLCFLFGHSCSRDKSRSRLGGLLSVGKGKGKKCLRMCV